MFTGIIEDIGNVTRCGSGVLTVETRLNEIKQGDSISVNGVCLTVTAVVKVRHGARIDFDFTPETESRTNIADLRKNSQVNLERALRVGDRLSGHILTGHIEGTGKLLKKDREGNSYEFIFSVAADLSKYITSKGSVAVDGTSLTVVDSDRKSFSVSIIPHTMSHTNLGKRQIGEKVNIEPDILAKYVEHLLGHNESRTITSETLRDYGFSL